MCYTDIEKKHEIKRDPHDRREEDRTVRTYIHCQGCAHPVRPHGAQFPGDDPLQPGGYLLCGDAARPCPELRCHPGRAGASGVQRGEQPLRRGLQQYDEPRLGGQGLRHGAPQLRFRPLLFAGLRRAVFPAGHGVPRPSSGDAGGGRDHRRRHRGVHEVDGVLRSRARHFERGAGLPGAGGGGHPPCQHRHHERLRPEYCAGPHLYPALGAGHGSRRGGLRHLPVQLRRLPVLLRPAVCPAWGCPPPSRTF